MSPRPATPPSANKEPQYLQVSCRAPKPSKRASPPKALQLLPLELWSHKWGSRAEGVATPSTGPCGSCGGLRGGRCRRCPNLMGALLVLDSPLGLGSGVQAVTCPRCQSWLPSPCSFKVTVAEHCRGQKLEMGDEVTCGCAAAEAGVWLLLRQVGTRSRDQTKVMHSAGEMQKFRFLVFVFVRHGLQYSAD